MNGNKKKAIQLGMPYGTASNRLKKKLLFSLAQQTQKDFCFQCNEKIKDINNFSIEHKVPWLDSSNPKELFYDLDNIAFSHLSCNISSRRIDIEKCRLYGQNNGMSKIGPEGTAWCGFCKTYKDKKHFTFNKRARDKTEWICKDCRIIYRSKK